MRLLHIVASPRGEASRSLRIAQTFLNAYREKHTDLSVDTLDLFKLDLPEVVGEKIDAKYSVLSGAGVEGKERVPSRCDEL